MNKLKRKIRLHTIGTINKILDYFNVLLLKKKKYSLILNQRKKAINEFGKVISQAQSKILKTPN